MILQDAPFLAFRLLIILHYKNVTYMNVFFTCKNTLVILLQLYRLYVVHSENRKTKKKIKMRSKGEELTEVYVISGSKKKKRHKRPKDNSDDDCEVQKKKSK